MFKQTIVLLGLLTIHVSAFANGTYWFDPSAQTAELYESELVLGYGQIYESHHASGCQCLKAQVSGNPWPDVQERSTLHVWMGLILEAKAQGLPIKVQHTDDWKIISVSTPGNL